MSTSNHNNTYSMNETTETWTSISNTPSTQSPTSCNESPSTPSLTTTDQDTESLTSDPPSITTSLTSWSTALDENLISFEDEIAATIFIRPDDVPDFWPIEDQWSLPQFPSSVIDDLTPEWQSYFLLDGDETLPEAVVFPDANASAQADNVPGVDANGSIVSLAMEDFRHGSGGADLVRFHCVSGFHVLGEGFFGD
ncbi:hypothetical protein BDV28DRAFT_145894 [Aspergillus coremiiformis]|uniref:Uncharacterized protein n=1 Tax=Aspergillus coremiiformis TaxID=138285 RepID=A0A5N6ZFZ4_9EURO|nr:hypothetical protein BDV28DRAFT_145894 [Aspergillus coremiiformis]